MSRPESWVVLEDQPGRSSGICLIKKKTKNKHVVSRKLMPVLLKKMKTWSDAIIS